MKTLKEYSDGFRWIIGATESGEFEKGSDIYNEKLAEGYELVLIPDDEKSAHELQQAKDAANQEAKAYLASTDWYVMRKFDSGEPMPEDVRDARAEARAKVS